MGVHCCCDPAAYLNRPKANPYYPLMSKKHMYAFLFD